MRLCLLLLLLCIPVSATTYYVDFTGPDTNNGTSKSTPWKFAPGMAGCANTCASTTLVAGDIVTFKGGVTWSSGWYLWTISTSGSAGNPITYTTDHTWFTGASYTQPILDGNQNNAQSITTSSGVHHITINDLHIQNIGIAHNATSAGVKAIQLQNSHDSVITNCTFNTETQITLYFSFLTAGSYSNFTLTGNNYSHTSAAVWFASAQANTSEHNITYTNSFAHDYNSQIGNGVHGDGFWHYFGVPSSDSTQFVDGVIFCNNKAYGDFRNTFDGGPSNTAFFFTEGGFAGTVCNNDFSFSPVQASMFQAMIDFSGNSNTKAQVGVGVYNNTIVDAGVNAMSDAIDLSGGQQNVTLKNNIATGMTYCVFVEDTASETGFVSDYNTFNCSGSFDWAGSIKSNAQWQALGFDTHGVLGSNPLLISPPNNNQLQSSSPSISVGLNLTSLGITILDSDYSGISRPSSAAWDDGAYQFAGSPASFAAPTAWFMASR